VREAIVAAIRERLTGGFYLERQRIGKANQRSVATSDITLWCSSVDPEPVDYLLGGAGSRRRTQAHRHIRTEQLSSDRDPGFGFASRVLGWATYTQIQGN